MEYKSNIFTQNNYTCSNRFQDKCSIDVAFNKYTAERLKADSIWKSLHLEGVPLTCAQTETILDGFTPGVIPLESLFKTLNLKRAWDFILSILGESPKLQVASQINKILNEPEINGIPGTVRKCGVSITGTNWRPEIPDKDKIQIDLEDILSNGTITEQSIRIMLYMMRTQAFTDGNKRTAMLLANLHMISNGKGLIAIPIECIPEFRDLLIKFYETNNYEQIMEFVYDFCVRDIS